MITREGNHYIADGPFTNADIAKAMETYLGTNPAITSVAEAKVLAAARLRNLEREEFHVLFLTNKHHLIEVKLMSIGTINSASVYPREIVKCALRLNAAAVILAHNHPSGIPEPSQTDKALTTRITNALELIEVRVVDHLIVGNDEVLSFAEKGLME